MEREGEFLSLSVSEVRLHPPYSGSLFIVVLKVDWPGGVDRFSRFNNSGP